MMQNTKYQSSRPSGFRQEDFVRFSLYKPLIVKHLTAGPGPFLTQGYNLNKLGSHYCYHSKDKSYINTRILHLGHSSNKPIGRNW